MGSGRQALWRGPFFHPKRSFASGPESARRAASERQFFRELRAGETGHEGQPLHRGLPLDGRDDADPPQGMGEPGESLPAPRPALASLSLARRNLATVGHSPSEKPLFRRRGWSRLTNDPSPSPGTNVPA